MFQLVDSSAHCKQGTRHGAKSSSGAHTTDSVLHRKLQWLWGVRMGRAEDREALLAAQLQSAQLLMQTLQHNLGTSGSTSQRQCDSNSSSSSSMTTSSCTTLQQDGSSLSQELSSLSDSLDTGS